VEVARGGHHRGNGTTDATFVSAGDPYERIVVTDSLNPRSLLPVANYEKSPRHAYWEHLIARMFRLVAIGSAWSDVQAAGRPAQECLVVRVASLPKLSIRCALAAYQVGPLQFPSSVSTPERDFGDDAPGRLELPGRDPGRRPGAHRT
jgi:hypothetical protein